jgi:hypothetical protein
MMHVLDSASMLSFVGKMDDVAITRVVYVCVCVHRRDVCAQSPFNEFDSSIVLCHSICMHSVILPTLCRLNH